MCHAPPGRSVRIPDLALHAYDWHAFRLIVCSLIINWLDRILATLEFFATASACGTCWQRCLACSTSSYWYLSLWVNASLNFPHRWLILQVELISISMTMSVNIAGAVSLGRRGDTIFRFVFSGGCGRRGNIFDRIPLFGSRIHQLRLLQHHHFCVI